MRPYLLGIFGMDVGGTLTKIVYFEANMDRSSAQKSNSPDSSPLSNATVLPRNESFPNLEAPEQKEALMQLYNYMDNDKGNHTQNVSRDENLTFYSSILNGRLHFLQLETRNLIGGINYLSSTAITDNIRTIGCTGGGAHKYSTLFQDQLEITVEQMDELGCLLKGMDFALTNVLDECYTYRFDETQDSSSNKPLSVNSSGAPLGNSSPKQDQWRRDVKQYTKKVSISKEIFTSKEIFPYLVVNIGSGVSIMVSKSKLFF
jgi:type II pantothenate kinase